MKFKRLLRNWDIWGFLRWRNYICCWEKEFLKMTSNDKSEWVGTKSSKLKPWRRRVLGTWREFDNRRGILDKKLVIILTVSVVWGKCTVSVSESQQKSGQEPETQPHHPIYSRLKLSETSSREKLQFLTVWLKRIRGRISIVKVTFPSLW